MIRFNVDTYNRHVIEADVEFSYGDDDGYGQTARNTRYYIYDVDFLSAFIVVGKRKRKIDVTKSEHFNLIKQSAMESAK
jgi:hypothetical protein